MSDLTISVAHNNARLNATIATADAGAGKSRIRLYDASDVLLATVTLAKPCGSIVSDKLVLTQDNPTADMIVATGTAVRADWINGAGVSIGGGAVTDNAGDGPFKLGGTSGTSLYAGGLVVLGTTQLE